MQTWKLGLALGILIFILPIGFSLSGTLDSIGPSVETVPNSSPAGLVGPPLIDSADTELRDQIEKTWRVRSGGILRIVNPRGKIRVRGWQLDQVRVTAERIFKDRGLAKDKGLIESTDVSFRESRNVLELTANYALNLPLLEKIDEDLDPLVTIDLDVRAPSNLVLEIWSKDSSVQIDDWNQRVNVRSNSGSIDMQEIIGSEVGITCSLCKITLSKIKAALRVFGGGGDITISEVDTDLLSVSSTNGNMNLSDISGRQLYHSQDGHIAGRALRGEISFRTVTGSAEFDRCGGSVSGYSRDGKVRVDLDRWKTDVGAFIETKNSDIEILLPQDLLAQFEVNSKDGRVLSDFQSSTVDPSHYQLIQRRRERNAPLFQVDSQQGNISIRKRAGS